MIFSDKYLAEYPHGRKPGQRRRRYISRLDATCHGGLNQRDLWRHANKRTEPEPSACKGCEWILDRFCRRRARRRSLPVLSCGAGRERVQARFVCARARASFGSSQPQQPDSFRHGVSLARFGVRHARLQQHDHLPDARRNARPQHARRGVNVPRCDREDSLSCRARG